MGDTIECFHEIAVYDVNILPIVPGFSPFIEADDQLQYCGFAQYKTKLVVAHKAVFFQMCHDPLSHD